VLRCALLAAIVLTLAPAAGAQLAFPAPIPLTRTILIHYRAHDGKRRNAYVLLPAWYGKHRHPPIPLIISPHGRGLTGRANSRIWGALPARGSFAVVSPDGEGRLFGAYSWGAAGQIADLARMPEIVRRTLPWMRIDQSKIYAFGGSMGGQESLLLLARHPHLLAGAAVFDAVTDFVLQYRDFPRIPCDKRCLTAWKSPIGAVMQILARREVGGSPKKAPLAWRLRSPVTYARGIAASHVPLQLWWSHKDRIVSDQQRQTQRLVDLILSINPAAPVETYDGYWRHSAEMKAKTRLPLALANFGLLPGHYAYLARQVHVWPLPPEEPPPPLPGRRPFPRTMH